MADKPGRDLTGMPPGAFPFPGAHRRKRWPSQAIPRYELAFGVDRLPKWGLAIYEGTGFSEHRRQLTQKIPTTELQEWLDPRTGPEAAMALVRGMADGDRDLFTDTAKPPTKS
jgi:hypothetical protein